MKNNIIIISISVVLSVVLSFILTGSGGRLGSAVIQTETTDTIETFRTNVNTSLTSLQNDRVSTTTAYSWTQAQSFFATTTIGATASTTITAHGKVGIASSTPTVALSIGSTGTSTTMGNFFCSYYKDEAGRGMWIKLATSGSTVFSTSTVSCQ